MAHTADVFCSQIRWVIVKNFTYQKYLVFQSRVHALHWRGDYTRHTIVDNTFRTIAASKIKFPPVDSGKFISSSLTSLFSANKETNTCTGARTQSCLIKLTKQSSSGRKVSRGCTVSAIYKLLPQISRVPCEESWETCHWKRAAQLPVLKRKKHITWMFCRAVSREDDIIIASCPQSLLRT